MLIHHSCYRCCSCTDQCHVTLRHMRLILGKGEVWDAVVKWLGHTCLPWLYIIIRPHCDSNLSAKPLNYSDPDMIQLNTLLLSVTATKIPLNTTIIWFICLSLQTSANIVCTEDSNYTVLLKYLSKSYSSKYQPSLFKGALSSDFIFYFIQAIMLCETFHLTRSPLCITLLFFCSNVFCFGEVTKYMIY